LLCCWSTNLPSSNSTLLPKEMVVPSGELYEVSPEVGRPRRTLLQSSNHLPDEAATVISVSSGISAPAKTWRKSQFGKNASKKKISQTPGETHAPAESDCMSFQGDALPQPSNRYSPPTKTPPSTQAGQRVSLSPFDTSEELILPEFKGRDHEKLRACLGALTTWNHADRPTFANNKTSKFASNIKTVSDFVRAVIESNGRWTNSTLRVWRSGARENLWREVVL
jgi:hypothetical protein